MGMARALVEQHGGEVPRTMEALVEAAGRRTEDRERRSRPCARRAGPAGRSPRACACRIALASQRRRIRSRSSISWARRCRPTHWTKASDTLILHGRRICKPKPLCDLCAVRDDCDYYRKVMRKAKTFGRREPCGCQSVEERAPDRRGASPLGSGEERGRRVPRQKLTQAVRPALSRAGLGRQGREGDRALARRRVSRDRAGHRVLTLRLAPLVSRLSPIEIDRDLIAASVAEASRQRHDRRRRRARSGPAGSRFRRWTRVTPVRVAGNLPYNMSSPDPVQASPSAGAAAR